jgi:hypothetical protein
MMTGLRPPNERSVRILSAAAREPPGRGSRATQGRP